LIAWHASASSRVTTLTSLRLSLSFFFFVFNSNKRRILQFLVPVKLMLGHMPRPAMLTRYGLQPFAQLATALRQGSVRAFNNALAEHQELFIAKGIYLLLEKLKILACT
jgi:hypothetical protein